MSYQHERQFNSVIICQKYYRESIFIQLFIKQMNQVLSGLI